DLGAGLRVVRGEDALVGAGVEIVAIDDRRRHVGAAALLAPGDRIARLLALGERDVAVRRAQADRVDRLDGRVAGGDVGEAVRGDRGRSDDLRVAGEAPQLLAGQWIVAADALGGVGHQLGALLGLEDRGRRPRRDLFTLGAPDLMAVFEVVGGDEGAFLQV